MDTASLTDENARAQNSVSEAREQRRLTDEADVYRPDIAGQHRQRTLRALADVDSGRLIDDEAMRAWADSLATDQEMPAPQPR